MTVSIDDAFIVYLLEIIESVNDDADDPYHYPVIRVLVCEVSAFELTNTNLDTSSF